MTIVARIVGGIISFGLLLGVIWGGGSPIISFVPPLLLLVLISFPERKVYKYFNVFIVAFWLSIISLFVTGLPFLTTENSFDVDIIYSIQWLLIAYFLLHPYVKKRKRKDGVTH